MQNLKVVSKIFLFLLACSLTLLGVTAINGSIDNWIGAFFIGALATSTPVLVSSFLCKYFLKRTSGYSSYIVFLCFFVNVLAWLGMYVYFYFQPAEKAAGLEYILIPINQLMAIPFAALVGFVLKNRVKAT
ncbi:hypothetical protein CWB73_16345 [Pseudoalteromonas phenolica]|uniref:Uncharacterized protein n=1 Tax=Pseudoalteromonas phenolica TaxID=161398 RepID=A0A5S3YQ00_9GAMM|nr:hypothetical protein [Pseudoalteromonas phenolica]TMP78711.1 hypothetical protein CWB73_16345 [Pseudoalteromonas phenolica]